MSNQEKPLPKPPTTAFGRKKPSESGEEQQSLLADRMAAAMAEGKLDEFMKQEMPDNEYARNLASMMMGMTGMMMPQGFQPAATPNNQAPQPTSLEDTEQMALSTTEVPEEVRNAIMGGDVQGLMEMLRKEHQKRNPDAHVDVPQPAEQEPAAKQGMPAIDKELIDALVKIAQDNSVSLDWIILRAIKVYVQEYQKTGKL